MKSKRKIGPKSTKKMHKKSIYYKPKKFDPNSQLQPQFSDTKSIK